jgi:E3 ubiquitin-protein ligase RNF1/2
LFSVFLLSHILAIFPQAKQELRCVICLDFIRNARIVQECLHRFCEQCIERMLQQVGRRNECPICRQTIPSRRSLAPDPGFDRLVSVILENYQPPEDGLEFAASSLQKAIHKKRQASQKVARCLEASGTGAVEEDADEEIGDSDSAASRSSTATGATAEDGRNQEYLTNQRLFDASGPPTLVKIELRLHTSSPEVSRVDAILIEDLRMPYLTISGDAPVLVLKRFLAQKHGLFNLANFDVWSVLHGQRELLSDSTTLTAVVKNLRDYYEGYLPLYYRISTSY